MKVWMSKATKQNNHYALGAVASVLGIVLLGVLLVVGVSLGAGRLGISGQWVHLIACVAVAALLVFLAASSGQRAQRDATIFWCNDQDQLFVVDARNLVRYGRGAVGFAQGSWRVQRTLEAIKEALQNSRTIPGAMEILKVVSIREHTKDCTLVCYVRHPSGKVRKHTVKMVRGYEEEVQLRMELERRKTWAVELQKNYNPLGMVLCFGVLAGCIALCAMSHPAIGRLPEAIYFPCMGAAVCCFAGGLYFAIRQHRGE